MPLLADPLLMLYHLLVGLHVSVGALALVLFWLPLMVTRGSARHKRMGKWYITAMYLICGSGAVMATGVLISPQYFKPEIFNSAENVAETEMLVRQFWYFLLFLCVLVLSNIRQALFALNEKAGMRQTTPWRAMILPAILLAFSAALALIAVKSQGILFGIFSLLGIANAVGMLRYLRLTFVDKKQQIVEHIGNICGSGIGVYTAFFAFGGRTLFEELGQWQLAFWVLPGVVGTVLINYAVKPYKSRPQKPLKQAAQ